MGNCQTNNTPILIKQPTVANSSFLDLIHSGDLLKVKNSISFGSEINYQHPTSGNTALMVSSHAGDYKMVGLLLNYGACPSIKNNTGYNALSYAASNGHVEIGRLLLFKLNNWSSSQKWDDMINGKSTNSNETPLMQAVYGGHRDFVFMLLDYGADVTIQTKYGWTALDFAKSKNLFEIIYLLSEKPFLDFKTPRCAESDTTIEFENNICY